MPTGAALEAYYARYYVAARDPGPAGDTDPSDGGTASVTFDEPVRFARMLADATPWIHRGALRVLDFGGGDGTLAAAVASELLARGRAAAVDVTIADPTPARPSYDARIVVSSVPSLDDVVGHFDLVIASAILEHIPALGAAARALFARVDPGGAFYARTPYWAPFAALLPHVDLTFPGHVHDLGPEFWNAVTSTFGIPADVAASRPSIVETSLRRAPVRTAAATVLKAPGRLEAALRPGAWRRPLWPWVGGWEVVLRFHGAPERPA